MIKGGVSSVGNADFSDKCPVDAKSSRYLDIRSVERHHFFVPVGVREFKEEGSERLSIVEITAGEHLHIRFLDSQCIRSILRTSGFFFLISWGATSSPSTSLAFRLLLERRISSGVSFFSIQSSILVQVKTLHQLDVTEFLAAWSTWSAGSAWASWALGWSARLCLGARGYEADQGKAREHGLETSSCGGHVLSSPGRDSGVSVRSHDRTNRPWC